MHLFKITLAFSSMAALTLADTGTVKSVDIVSGTGLIRPDKGGEDVLMVFKLKNTGAVIKVDLDDKVSYDLSNDGKGMAVNVKLLQYKEMLISDGEI